MSNSEATASPSEYRAGKYSIGHVGTIDLVETLLTEGNGYDRRESTGDSRIEGNRSTLTS